MGIFSEDSKEDVRAINFLIEETVQRFRAQAPLHNTPYEIVYQGRGNEISDVGGRIIKAHFEDPRPLHRIALLLILSNVYGVFSLVRDGRMVLDLVERRKVLAAFTCLVVDVALSGMTFQLGDRKYWYRWKGFPNEYFRIQFLVSLELIPPAQLHPTTGRGQTQKDPFDRILAQMFLTCAMLLEYCVAQEGTETGPEKLPPGAGI